eukprot:9725421-Alexandrium_andersonii.AAC.1
MVQPPRREPQRPASAGSAPGPQFYRIGAGSEPPSTPRTYRTEQGVRNTPDSRAGNSKSSDTEDTEMEYVVLPRTP